MATLDETIEQDRRWVPVRRRKLRGGNMEPFLTTALKIVWLLVGLMIIIAPFTNAF